MPSLWHNSEYNQGYNALRNVVGVIFNYKQNGIKMKEI